MEQIPKILEAHMAEVGLNTAEQMNYKGRVLYCLSLVDSEGSLVPTGLPCIVEIKGNELIKLSIEESFEILKDYEEE